MLYTGKDENTTSFVPNVIGKSVEEANKILTNSGFNVNIEGSINFKYGQGAIVVAQSYSEGVCLSKGTIITIKVLFTEEKD